jgi:hypothetical protein
MLIGKIKIEQAGMLGDAGTDCPLGSIKLCARFEQIEPRPDGRRARCGSGRVVVAAPQPGSETFAANGPSFSVAVRYDIGECDPGGSVKQLLTERHLLEHIGGPQAALSCPHQDLRILKLRQERRLAPSAWAQFLHQDVFDRELTCPVSSPPAPA